MWTDRYGTGTVHIRFEPEIGRFIGDWGVQGIAPTLEFDGFRRRPPTVSSIPCMLPLTSLLGRLVPRP